MISDKENKIEDLENHIRSIYEIIGNITRNHPLDHTKRNSY